MRSHAETLENGRVRAYRLYRRFLGLVDAAFASVLGLFSLMGRRGGRVLSLGATRDELRFRFCGVRSGDESMAHSARRTRSLVDLVERA